MNLIRAVSSVCAALYAQCGGEGYSGVTCCQSGSICIFSSSYYSQCLPGSSSSVITSTTTAVISTTPITTKTTTTTTTITTATTTTATTASSTTSSITTSSVPGGNILAPAVRGSYWAATTDSGGCSLPIAGYSTPHGAVALGDQAALGALSFNAYYCGQILSINCGFGSVSAIVASTCDITGHDCGVDMILPTWNAATNNATPGLTTCSVALTNANPIVSTAAAICYYRPASEFTNQYYKLLSVLNTSGRLLVAVTLAGIQGTLSSGNWYAFQAGASPFQQSDSVIFSYKDGSQSSFTLSECVEPTGVQIFS